MMTSVNNRGHHKGQISFPYRVKRHAASSHSLTYDDFPSLHVVAHSREEVEVHAYSLLAKQVATLMKSGADIPVPDANHPQSMPLPPLIERDLLDYWVLAEVWAIELELHNRQKVDEGRSNGGR